MRRRVLLQATASLLCLGAVAGLSAPAVAQTAIPSQITIVVPYPPGSSNDLFARLLAPQLSKDLGTTIIVENKPGASGDIGSAFVAKAKPDGATLLVTSNSYTTNAALASNQGYDPVNDLVPIVQIARGPELIAVNASSPYKTFADLVDAAKKDPGGLNYGTSGIGSLSHLANVLLNSTVGVEMEHIPYKGISESITDLMGGRIDMTIASLPSLTAQLNAGTIRALAVTTDGKSPLVPELPAVNATYPDYVVEIYWVVLGPSGLPQDLVERLNENVRKITSQPDMAKKFAEQGSIAGTMKVEQFQAAFRGDIDKWRKVVADNNIKP